jgi:hypothetical protein
MATKKPKPRSGPGSRTGKDARSGPNIPNEQRGTEQILLRCPPGTKAALAALAAAADVSMGQWVADAVDRASK